MQSVWSSHAESKDSVSNEAAPPEQPSSTVSAFYHFSWLRFPETAHCCVLECHVEPVVVILSADPAWRPEGEEEADLREDDGVGCWLGVVSCLLFVLVDTST